MTAKAKHLLSFSKQITWLLRFMLIILTLKKGPMVYFHVTSTSIEKPMFVSNLSFIQNSTFLQWMAEGIMPTNQLLLSLYQIKTSCAWQSICPSIHPAIHPAVVVVWKIWRRGFSPHWHREWPPPSCAVCGRRSARWKSDGMRFNRLPQVVGASLLYTHAYPGWNLASARCWLTPRRGSSPWWPCETTRSTTTTMALVLQQQWTWCTQKIN